jgi:hypothetical protein
VSSPALPLSNSTVFARSGKRGRVRECSVQLATGRPHSQVCSAVPTPAQWACGNLDTRTPSKAIFRLRASSSTGCPAANTPRQPVLALVVVLVLVVVLLVLICASSSSINNNRLSCKRISPFPQFLHCKLLVPPRPQSRLPPVRWPSISVLDTQNGRPAAANCQSSV